MTYDPHRRSRDAMAAHFAGAAAPAMEQEMRAHLPTCADCHAHYERHLLLSSLDPAGLPIQTRLARALGLPAPARAHRRPTLGWFALCGAAFAALVVFQAQRRTPGHPRAAAPVPSRAAGGPAVPVPEASAAPARSGSGEIAARGGLAAVAAARTPEVQIYRIYIGRRGTTSEKAGDFVYAGDELAFAYRNPSGKERILVFAVDEHGHVYWYHPGWSDAGENPTAVPISAEPGLHELPAAVLHKFDGERIMIHALFTDRELSVRQVETAVAAAGAREHAPPGTEPLALPGAIDVVRPLRVVR